MGAMPLPVFGERHVDAAKKHAYPLRLLLCEVASLRSTSRCAYKHGTQHLPVPQARFVSSPDGLVRHEVSARSHAVGDSRDGKIGAGQPKKHESEKLSSEKDPIPLLKIIYVQALESFL